MPAERLITRYSLRWLLAAAVLATLTPSAASAQTAPPNDPESARRALEDKKNELSATKDKAQVIQSTVNDLDTERERLNSRLVETAALIQRSESQLTAIEGRVTELEAQEKLVRGSLGQRHGQIATLLGALQRMGRNPPPVLITRREDALKMVRSAMLLSSAFPELRGQALNLGEQLSDLVRVTSDKRAEGQRLQAETDRLNEASKRLAGLMEAKKLSITERQSELHTVRAATAEISKNVDDLSQLIAQLDKNPALVNQTGLGAYEKELKSDPPAAALPTSTTTDATTSIAAVAVASPLAAAADDQKRTAVALLQPPKLKPPIVELAPSGSPLAPGNHDRMKPAIPFALAHAKLPLPAHGRRALAFGDRTQYGGQSKGLVLETRRGAQITSPTDGWIVYAGEFRSYGQLLIINAGDGYHILLAGMSRIDVQPGQFVLAAEPVGVMGGAAVEVSSSSQFGAPVLYVEFRKDGRPIDPNPWWSQQKVQD